MSAPERAATVLEQAKAQARVLVPLVKALQAELGEARANEIVRRTLGATYRRMGEQWWKAKGGADLGKGVAAAFEMYAAGNALDYQVLKQTADAFDMNVTGCRYAQFYQQLGAPELGFLLVCSADYDVADGFGGEVKLTRTQTLMQGASHCDFRYARVKSQR